MPQNPKDVPFVKSNQLVAELGKLSTSPVEQLTILTISLGGAVGAMTRGTSEKNFNMAVEEACDQVRTFAGIARKMYEELNVTQHDTRFPDDSTRH
jgi:hypothetical protein